MPTQEPRFTQPNKEHSIKTNSNRGRCLLFDFMVGDVVYYLILCSPRAKKA